MGRNPSLCHPTAPAVIAVTGGRDALKTIVDWDNHLARRGTVLRTLASREHFGWSKDTSFYSTHLAGGRERDIFALCSLGGLLPGSGPLRRELSGRCAAFAAANGLASELTTGPVPSVIFGADQHGRHGNFHPTSYRNICANSDWARRLAKLHNGHKKAWPRSEWRWRELDCSNSSDALLMNVFCYRKKVRSRALCSLLGVEAGATPEFGFRPGIPLQNGKVDRTEIDMKLGSLLFEAKLTENTQQRTPLRLIQRYRDLDVVLDMTELVEQGKFVRNYQLLRGALAAYATGGQFCLVCDSRRPDLIEMWYEVLRAVKDCTLRCRLHMLTWQELSVTLPAPLRRFLETKYGIAR